MKKLFLACGVAMALSLVSCNNSSAPADSFEDSLSTAIGESNGSQLNAQFQMIPESDRAQLSKEDVVRGIKDIILADTAKQGYYSGVSIGLRLNQMLVEMERSGLKIDRNLIFSEFAKTFMSDSISMEQQQKIQMEFNELMNRAQAIVMQKREEDLKSMRAAQESESADNLAAGNEFMENLKKDADVKFLPSGLAYKVEKQGTGAKPGPDTNCEVMYVGKLIDGTVFDQSKNPIEFTPAGTVPGFSEGLQMMNPGSKYTLYIPANLGYGDRSLPNIPANSVLVFDVEMISVDGQK